MFPGMTFMLVLSKRTTILGEFQAFSTLTKVVRYKWQKLYEINRNGIPYTGAENGAYIPPLPRIGTEAKEDNALDAFARRLADNMPAQPPIGRRAFVPTPPECRPPPIPRLPAINIDKFCERNGIHSSLTVYPNNTRY